MSFNTLLPLIKKTGSTLSPADFQHTINVVFHDIEANHYDAIHANMWDSLQEQINLLVDDVYAKEAITSKTLRLLDIGSGTGLSTELLLSSKFENHIGHITLLDTSPNMLKQAESKVKKWNKKYTLVNSDVRTLTEKYDVIIISSVLHHIPDLKQFLDKIDGIQNPGGILIHLQDRNGDYMNDPEYLERFNAYEKKLKEASPKSLKSLFPKSLKNAVKRLIGRKNYIDLVNDKLLELKAIKKRMTADEIWSVTDIHVENLPFSIGSGISIKFLKETLKNYSLVNSRSYGFFGFLKSELFPEYQPKEQQLISKNALNGRHVSAVWIKK
jgi:ubiquinone/menaquinone biosynthesis C-methylase UbiE